MLFKKLCKYEPVILMKQEEYTQFDRYRCGCDLLFNAIKAW